MSQKGPSEKHDFSFLPLSPAMAASSVAMLSTAVLGVGAYLNAKISVGTDLQQLRNDRAWMKRAMKLIDDLGDTCTLYHLFDKVDSKIKALWFEGRTWTYGELKNGVDRLAGFLRSNGVISGGFVAVFMTNSPEMIITILALSKLGAVAALINSALRGATLTQCLNISAATMMLSTPDISSYMTGDLPHFCLSLFAFSGISPHPSSAAKIISISDLPTASFSMPAAKRSLSDLAILIYTSGTTGFPKACAIHNQLIIIVSTPLSLDVNSPFRYFPLRTYSALPLFHATGLFMGLCYVTGTSGTFCLSRRFSSSRFWKEVTVSGATRILYVGELCRYLLNTAAGPDDRAHKVIVAHGNGLRPDVWNKFKSRFNISEIREFYRSTEGLARFDNYGVGAWGSGKIGFRGPIARWVETDTFIIRINLETGEPVRDPKTGFCIHASLGEPGEPIGRIKSRALLTEYLNNTEATEAKLLADVFIKGDAYQRTGDLVLMDSDGWISFQDRLGDTFRWKGENVSASEVRDLILKVEGVADAVIYGVKLQSYDGQAGAAAITLSEPSSGSEPTFIAVLHDRLQETGLPGYAIPRLVRITKGIATNATFKQAKTDLIRRKWDPSSADDDTLYWLDGTVYRRLNDESWIRIERGDAKL